MRNLLHHFRRRERGKGEPRPFFYLLLHSHVRGEKEEVVTKETSSASLINLSFTITFERGGRGRGGENSLPTGPEREKRKA